MGSKNTLWIYLALLILGLTGTGMLVMSMPVLEGNECKEMSWRLFVSGDRRDSILYIWRCSHGYVNDHYWYSMLLLSVGYIVNKAFAIPGPALVLSVLAGALARSMLQAQFIVTTCELIGSSICYQMSYLVGEGILEWLTPGAIAKFAAKIKDNEDNLLWYMLFLRLTPLVPGWVINLSSKIVGVPWSYFAIATWIGVQASTYFSVSMGHVLQTLGEDKFELRNGLPAFISLIVLQFVALIPVMMKKEIKDTDAKHTRKKD